MNRKLLVLACLATLALAACKREEPAPPAAAEPAPAPQAVVEAAPTGETPAMAASFDMKGFAGTFSGGKTALELKPDGSYVVKDGNDTMDGTWTVEAGDTRVRLDPNTKAQDDRLFQINGKDGLVAVDADGKPLSGEKVLELKRGTP